MCGSGRGSSRLSLCVARSVTAPPVTPVGPAPASRDACPAGRPTPPPPPPRSPDGGPEHAATAGSRRGTILEMFCGDARAPGGRRRRSWHGAGQRYAAACLKCQLLLSHSLPLSGRCAVHRTPPPPSPSLPPPPATVRRCRRAEEGPTTGGTLLLVRSLSDGTRWLGAGRRCAEQLGYPGIGIGGGGGATLSLAAPPPTG